MNYSVGGVLRDIDGIVLNFTTFLSCVFTIHPPDWSHLRRSLFEAKSNSFEGVHWKNV